MHKTLFRLSLIVLVLALASLACGLFDDSGEYYEDAGYNEPYEDEPLSTEQESRDALSADDAERTEEEGPVYYDLPEDCLEGEAYDPVEQLCICVDCDFADADFQSYLDTIWDEAQTESTADSNDEEQRLVIYSVNANEISNPEFQDVSGNLTVFQQDSQTQQEIWTYFTNMIPLENREMLTTYIVSTDGVDNTMAAVEQDPNDPARWVLIVDIADAKDPKDLTYTLIHEYGHLLTLNADQVEPNTELLEDPENEDLYYAAVEACPLYFPGEGCSLPNAYINAFYNRFWGEIYDEWQDLDTILDDDIYYDTLDGLYLKYQDQFVTEYAATNPEEDIAETWTYFVLKPKPEGDTIAEEKVLFFYEYPELIVLREEILTRTYARLQGE